VSDLTPERGLIFRITHIANVPWILTHGLHCANSRMKDADYRIIGNRDLITKRADRVVPIHPKGTLSDYIPFYFAPCSPMLLNIKTGYGGIQETPMSDIVFLVSSLHKLNQHDRSFVFTDRHAYLSTARFFNNIDDLNSIDWTLLNSRDFKRDPNDPGKVERYQAEALVYEHLPVSMLTHIVSYNQEQRDHVNALIYNASVNVTIVMKPNWYCQ